MGAVAIGCVPSEGAETDSSPEETTTTTSTGTDGASSTSATEATTGATEASETGEPGPPAACSEPDPAVSSEFSLEFMSWHLETVFAADVPCVVDAVEVMGNTVITTMTCEVNDAPEPASLSFAFAPEGVVDWGAGMAVRLAVKRNFDFASQQIVQLRASGDDALLVVAASGGMDNNTGYPEAFLPLIYGYSAPCPGGEAGAPAQIDIEDPDGGEIHLISQHRGSLPIDATHVYAIDVGPTLIGDSPHYPISHEVLLRRVDTDG